MQETRQENEPASATLCKACGLCCTGHLFVNAEFRPDEVEATQALGLSVLQTDPEKPVFRLPCPLWKGQCSIYTHPHKPSICGAFKCKLLKELQAGEVQLEVALGVVGRIRQWIRQLERQIPPSQSANFRLRLFEYVGRLERSASPSEAENSFRLKAGALLVLFAGRFGVKGLFNAPEQEGAVQAE